VVPRTVTLHGLNIPNERLVELPAYGTGNPATCSIVQRNGIHPCVLNLIEECKVYSTLKINASAECNPCPLVLLRILPCIWKLIWSVLRHTTVNSLVHSIYQGYESLGLSDVYLDPRRLSALRHNQFFRMAALFGVVGRSVLPTYVHVLVIFYGRFCSQAMVSMLQKVYSSLSICLYRKTGYL
jgi:hypothetical protein